MTRRRERRRDRLRVWQKGSPRIPPSLDAGCGSMTWTTPSLASCQRVCVPRQSAYLDTSPNQSVGLPGDQNPMFSSSPGWLRVSRRRARKRRWRPSGCCRRSAWRRANESLRPRVVPYVAGVFSLDASRRWTGSMVLMLAALLLLPPCANIGILVYARAVTRREEFATRYALGASRGRIVTQMFVEVLVLAAAAGTAGWLLQARSASPSGSRKPCCPRWDLAMFPSGSTSVPR